MGHPRWHRRTPHERMIRAFEKHGRKRFRILRSPETYLHTYRREAPPADALSAPRP